jgi:hypothetical protein
MRTTILKIFVCSTILFSSCNNNYADNFSEKQTKTPDFLKRYTKTTLPIKIKGCEMNSTGLPLINLDSIYSGNEDGFVPYCSFPTNGDYYAVIRLGLADCTLPYLMTYAKSGKVIDEQFIGIGRCGSGPGFHCEEFAIIGVNLKSILHPRNA